MGASLRYVIYSTQTGAIRAVIRGTSDLAEANVSEGEALVQFFGFVSAATHMVQGGQVTLKT